MPGRLGPRFAIEALFLIALAAGAAYADLAGRWIAVVMAGGWLVVALLELSAERIWAAAPPWRRPYYVPASPPRAETAPAQASAEAVEPKPEVEPRPEPQREPTPAPQTEAVTIIAPRAEQVTPSEPEPAPEIESDAGPEPVRATEPVLEPEPEPTDATLARPKLEPLEAAPKRRWFRRREPEPAAAEVPEIELPKHVRLLPATERGDRSSEVTDLFDVPENEERSHK
jgi:hypothetical protein